MLLPHSGWDVTIKQLQMNLSVPLDDFCHEPPVHLTVHYAHQSQFP
jgi:hypothetical protein